MEGIFGKAAVFDNDVIFVIDGIGMEFFQLLKYLTSVVGNFC